MKPIYEGKSRLAGVLSIEDRASLSLMMLQHVLQAISNAITPLERWVIGGDKWVQAIATLESAVWLPDQGGGPNEVIRRATMSSFKTGVRAVLVLPGDLGLLQSSDVDQMVDLSRGLSRAVLAQATADGGTNAILIPDGLLINPSFGPGSFERHMMAARKAEIPFVVSEGTGLEFDLDRPEDLLFYRDKHPDLDEALTCWNNKLNSQELFKANL